MVTVTKPAGNEAFKAFVDALAGAMGSLFAAVVLYPLDVVKTRQQVAVEGDSTTEGEHHHQHHINHQHHIHHHHHHGKKRPSNMFALCWVIYRAEGLEGLFAGLSSKMAHTLFASFAYFYWYAMLKQAAERRSGKTITTGMNLIVAAAAGALNMSMTLPLEMINTRAQITASDSESDSDGDVAKTEPKVEHKGMWQLTKEIYAEGGLLAFWKGYIPSLVLVTNPSINFTVFDKLKLRMQQWKTQRVSGGGDVKRLVALTMFEAFVIAAIAKAIATILTYPIIRAKVLMQAQKTHLESEDATTKTDASNPQAAHKHHHERKDYGDSMLAVLQNIGAREGLPGFFKGCSAQLFNTVLKSALLLMTKEQIYTYTMRVLYSLRREKVAAAAAAAAVANKA